MNLFKKLILASAIGACFVPVVNAEMSIEITEGIESALPIAIVPFESQGAPLDISKVVDSDLTRSGYFKTLSLQQMPAKPTSADAINFPDWQSIRQNYVVIGRIQPNGGQYTVEFQLFDVANGSQLLGYRMTSTANDLRKTAHNISDMIYEKILGKKGVFSGRIAYITSTRQDTQSTHNLMVADADGANAKAIATSIEPLMSPAWSPDAKRLAYVSFEKKTAAIYIQTLATGQRERVAEFPGINGAPAWSPDGLKLAVTLSKDGSPDIYILDLGSRNVTKLTKNRAIDTEPTWSPDGSRIVFTSDRGGKPQLYSIPVQGGEEKRITFSGSYNARASFSPDGKFITMVHGNGGDYRIGVMEANSKSISVLTTGPLDESPSFAPNGSMVLYASRKGSTGYLSAVSTDGRIQQKLVFDSAEVREPAWSPK
ncbi:MAG: Tol-Pal system beta propeller repeat protein TolB [Methylococcales bacterium]|nr:Tol-Pal system beta propeller repeat protein TolB [Methylococcales bacterium]